MTTADQPHRIEEGQKRVRVYLGGEVVADTTRPRLVWEVPHYPQYYFPIDDVRTDLLVAMGDTKTSPTLGAARLFTVKAGGKEATAAAWRYEDAPMAEVRDLVRFDWASMDAWFEEDEEVFVLPATRTGGSTSSPRRGSAGRARRRHSRRVVEPQAAVRDRPARRATTCRSPTSASTCWCRRTP